MSISSIHATAFYRDVARSRRVWTIRDSTGFPTSKGAMPFWSSRARALKVVTGVPAYADFAPLEITLDEFLERWIPGLERDALKVGVNWSGTSAIGYEVEPAVVLAAIDHALGSRPRSAEFGGSD